MGTKFFLKQNKTKKKLDSFYNARCTISIYILTFFFRGFGFVDYTK